MIRKTEMKDLPELRRIYACARKLMKETGNPNQWRDNGPGEDLVVNDINNANSYVMEDDAGIYAVFSFIIGEDVTYGFIEGQWLNDEPYGTIHRIASDGTHRGIMRDAVEYCSQRVSNLRIDTHEDNKIMQHQILKLGFTYCGTIYLLNGEPRRAYHKIVEKTARQ